MRKLSSAALGLLIALVFLTACGPTFQAGDPTNPIEISAEDMWDEFVANKEDAAGRYDGERVTVTGTIAEISEAFMGSPCIMLENGVVSIPDGIFCYFPDGFNVHDYSIGETITVAGTCSLAIHIAGDDTPFISIRNATVISSP